ncbi:hypothetical protein [Comamonas testosteroni]|uniref:Uncharacterized protein n=1 Tax=Comamonas testosteroni TaxID=285 RepID=A0A096HQJ6_COMTE|nr:hypothetical protein [Comamonas testosteroni]KGH31242.1 hypothetical protein P353_06745 [Comamonas testosteroni]
MKNKSLTSNTETFFSMQAISSVKGDDKKCFQFCGIDRSGQFRVKAFETKFLVDGAIYVLKEMIDYQGKKKMEKFLLEVSPGFNLNGNQDLYKMICSETGQPMLITGNFALCLEKSKS